MGTPSLNLAETSRLPVVIMNALSEKNEYSPVVFYVDSTCNYHTWDVLFRRVGVFCY